ncbi:CynX/NimT family MFS transporter [Leucothrix pacifica]|uniref:Major facilitator superfamily (MFS) profile domain-containing protein n=1 Tax=Leucothrix pacifica TaxID=1247513 RepID=A0A317CAN3_9GAMM|nr:MFS transporter [Leucothrix pacifica]PWQ94393.1 hypothetical protein DKW60_16610 [Leucothrix pacifica]
MTVNKTNWSLVLIIVFAGITAATNIGKVAPVIPLIQQELGLSLVNVGWVVSGFSLAAMFLCLLMSVLATQVGNYRLAVLALLMMGAGGLISANAGSFPALLSGRVTESLGFVMIAVTGPALLAKVALPEDMAIAITLWTIWLPVGVILMLLLSPLLVSLSGWRLVWSVTSWLSLAWALVLGIAVFKIGTAGDRAPRISRAEFRGLFHRNSWLLTLSMTCFSMAYLAATSFAPTFWYETHDISLRQGAYFLTFAMFGTMIGNLSSGLLVKRGYATRKLLLMAFVIPTLIGGCSFLTSLPFWVQYIGFVIFTTLAGAVPTVLMAVAPTYTSSPVQIGPSVAMVFQGATTGQVLGPILLSQLIEYHQHNWSWALLFFSVLAVMGSLLMSQVRPPE